MPGCGSRSSDDGSSYTGHLEDLDVPYATFSTPDLTVFCCLDELGLVPVGRRLDPDRAVIECRAAESDPWCWVVAARGLSHETETRRLAHEPFGHRPTTLLVRVRRYKCSGCGRSWSEDLVKLWVWWRVFHLVRASVGWRVLGAADSLVVGAWAFSCSVGCAC